MIETEYNIVQPPEGYSAPGFFATSFDKVVGLARKNSIWPLPFATSCCGIEFMALMGAHYDLARFGAERLSFSPRQADLLMVMGTIAKKMADVVPTGLYTNVGAAMGPCMGACASSGGIFDTYSVLQGIDRVVPVDVYVRVVRPGPSRSSTDSCVSRTLLAKRPSAEDIRLNTGHTGELRD